MLKLQNTGKSRNLALFGVLLLIIISIPVYLVIQRKPAGDSTAPATQTVRIAITTFNWGFNITDIPDFQFGKVYPSPTITVHRGQQVIIQLRTLDITHGFAIDELNVKAYVPPGETVTVTFIADRTGNFTYYCPVFCGIGHPYMHGTFQVLP